VNKDSGNRSLRRILLRLLPFSPRRLRLCLHPRLHLRLHLRPWTMMMVTMMTTAVTTR